MRIGNMAGLKEMPWAEGMLLGWGSGRRKSIGLWYFLETFYFYRAFVAGRKQP
jgi:hypothetical protein